MRFNVITQSIIVLTGEWKEKGKYEFYFDLADKNIVIIPTKAFIWNSIMIYMLFLGLAYGYYLLLWSKIFFGCHVFSI